VRAKPFSIISLSLAFSGFVLGYMAVPGLGKGLDHASTPDKIVFVLGGFVIGFFSFLKGGRVPPRAVFHIDAERLQNPDGPCSIKNLRGMAMTLLAICAAFLAWLGGHFVRGPTDAQANTLLFFLFIALGCLLAVGLCWHLLKLSRSRT